MANSTFDPEAISEESRLTAQAVIDTHLRGSLTLCNLIEDLAMYVINAKQSAVGVWAHRRKKFEGYLPSLLLITVAAGVDGS